MARSSSLYTMLGPQPTEPAGYRGKPNRNKATKLRGPCAPVGDADSDSAGERTRGRSTSRGTSSTVPNPSDASPGRKAGMIRATSVVSDVVHATSEVNAITEPERRASSARRDVPTKKQKTTRALTPEPQAPAPVVARPKTALLTPLKPLKVDGLTVQPCAIESLRPGDIGFVYQRHQRTRRQRLITLGERIINTFRRKRRGDAHIVHAFIVIKSNVEARKLLVADGAAGRKPFGINLMEMDFAHHNHVRPSAQYLFYRPTDAGLATRIAQVACTWTHANKVSNFSVRKAIHSTWHSARLSERAGERAMYFASQADNPGPLRNPGSRITYNMMCSEFVTNVCVAATLTQWQAGRHATGDKADMGLSGLWKGPAGDTFAIDGRGTPPSVLQARLAHSEAMRAVGYIAGSDAE